MTPQPQSQEPGLTPRLDEKRQAHRIRLSCSASYQTIEDNKPKGPLSPAVTIDLSTKGTLLRTGQPANLGERLHLQIQLPGSKERLVATGRVVRVQEEEISKQYLIGLVFEEINPPKPAEFLKRLESLDLRQILENLLKLNGSDLHLTTGQPPIARVRGHLVPMQMDPFQLGEIRALLYSILSEEQTRAFETQKELDFAYSLSPQQRFRFNLHWQRSQVEAAIRVIPPQVGIWKELGLPPVVIEWTKKASGLILIIGPTGSGKTTTLNTLVHQINQERDAIIICLERPIEYIHRNIKAVIKQREVGSDTLSYAEAVKRALRQDPDVIVVGEIDDPETAAVVMNAAETGNLVLASFHATNTIQALERLLSLFPDQQRKQTRFQLASCLQGVLTQYLLPREEAMGGGLILATEVFVPTEAARNMIRTDAINQLSSVIQTGITHQMYPLEVSIRQLIQKGQISAETGNGYLAFIGQQS